MHWMTTGLCLEGMPKAAAVVNLYESPNTTLVYWQNKGGGKIGEWEYVGKNHGRT